MVFGTHDHQAVEKLKDHDTAHVICNDVKKQVKLPIDLWGQKEYCYTSFKSFQMVLPGQLVSQTFPFPVVNHRGGEVGQAAVKMLEGLGPT